MSAAVAGSALAIWRASSVGVRSSVRVARLRARRGASGGAGRSDHPERHGLPGRRSRRCSRPSRSAATASRPSATNEEIGALRGPTTQVDRRARRGGRARLQRRPHAHAERRPGDGQRQPAGRADARRRAVADSRLSRRAHARLAWIRGRGWGYEPFPGGLPTRAAARRRRAGSAGGHALLRRTQHLGELEGARRGRHHEGHARSAATARSSAIRRRGEPTGLLKESPAMALVDRSCRSRRAPSSAAR